MLGQHIADALHCLHRTGTVYTVLHRRIHRYTVYTARYKRTEPGVRLLSRPPSTSTSTAAREEPRSSDELRRTEIELGWKELRWCLSVRLMPTLKTYSQLIFENAWTIFLFFSGVEEVLTVVTVVRLRLSLFMVMIGVLGSPDDKARFLLNASIHT